MTYCETWASVYQRIMNVLPAIANMHHVWTRVIHLSLGRKFLIDSFPMLYSIIYCSTIILYLLLCDKTMYMTCTVFTELVRILHCRDRTTTHVCILAPHILMHLHTVYIYIYCHTNMLHVLWVIAHLLYTRIQYICMHNTCKWRTARHYMYCTVQCRIARHYIYCTVHTGARVYRVWLYAHASHYIL